MNGPLKFLTVCYAAALIAWPILTDRHDTPLLTGQAILAGLFAGAFLTAWVG